MPYSEYRPEFMGTAVLAPSGGLEAGSMQSFTLVYTAGRFGIDDTGSIKIGFRFATDFGPVQEPPFGGSKEEYRRYFEPYFEFRHFETATNSLRPRQGRELFICLKKKILFG